MKAIMILAWLMLGLFNSGHLSAAELDGHPIFNHIMRLNPRLPKDYAMALSNTVVKLSKQYGVNPHIAVAIMRQESSIDPTNHRTAVGLDSYGNLIQVITDVGLMQVNVHSVSAYKLNAFMLMTDPEYQLWAGFKILGDKVKQCAKRYQDTAWACFHSATPEYHWEYVNAVRRWL